MRRYLFTVTEGPDVGRTLELRVGTTVFGRLPEEDESEGLFRWTLIDKTVNRSHAEVTLKDSGEPILRNLSLTNDTFVDGRKVEKENLQHGQQIQLGETIIKMEVIQ